MREDFGNHGRLFDGGDNLQGAATLRAVFDSDRENAFEQAHKTVGQNAAFEKGLELVCEVNCEKQGPLGMSLRIHVLRREGAGKLVGIEFVTKTFGSYGMMPVKLSTYEAQRLASFLNEAIRAP